MLPSFSWTIPGLLCGAGLPGLLNPVADDMKWLYDNGIRLIVTLTEEPLHPSPDQYGMQGLHCPVPDMGFPTPRAAASACREVLTSIDKEQAVLVHCRGGLGRTGLLLACCLVARGDDPEQALSTIRTIRPRYVQTEAQERFIGHFAQFLASVDRYIVTAKKSPT